MSEYIRTFNRFELKYLLHYRAAREFVEAISPHVRTDANAEGDGFYKVSSLYYDSPALSAYWEKMDGEKFRRKVRVRTYGPSPQDAYIEIKQRYNLSVQKRRCRFPIHEAPNIMKDVISGAYDGGRDRVLDEVFLLAQRGRLEPQVIISYNRMAFFDHFNRKRFKRCRRCALSWRILEDEPPVEADLFEKSQRLAKVVISLAGKANDHIRRQRDVRHHLTQP